MIRCYGGHGMSLSKHSFPAILTPARERLTGDDVGTLYTSHSQFLHDFRFMAAIVLRAGMAQGYCR